MWRWRVALVIWMGIIFLLSSSLFAPQMSFDNTVTWFGQLNYVVRKAAHAGEFGVLMWLWFRSLRVPNSPTGAVLFASFALTLLYASFDEWHQSFVPERSGKISDVGIDTVGALAMGFALFWASPTGRWQWLVGLEDTETGVGDQ